MLKRILLTSILLLIATSASAQQSYPGYFHCKDLSELENAIKAARPGDSIYMADGEWKDVVINFNSSATSQKRIALRAFHPGKVALTGKSKLRLVTPYLDVEGLVFRDGMSEEGFPLIDFRSDYGRVSDTAIIDFNPTDRKIGYNWVVFTGSNNQLTESYFTGKNNPRPVVANDCCTARHNTVSYNYFKDIAHVAENGREIIQVVGHGRNDEYTDDGAFFRVERNLFDHADGEGDEIISIKSNHNVIRNNTIRASRGGISLRNGQANTVESNYILGQGRSGTYGIRVQGPNNKVVNNYIDNVTDGLLLHTGEELFVRGCITDYLTVDFVPLKKASAPCGYAMRYGQVTNGVFAHNTLVNVSGVDIYVGMNYKFAWPYQQMVRIPESNLFMNNLIYKPAGGIAVTTQLPDDTPPINTLTFKPNRFLGNLVFGGELDITAPSSDAFGFTFADPLLTKVDEVYRLSQRSPAVNKGYEDNDRKNRSRIERVGVDIDGQGRDRPDIGADELSVGHKNSSLLLPVKVGPDWMRPRKR